MATTIQTIETPKKYRALDTSGNNNHGQIYSGRALEFDGISDYLDTGADTSIDPSSTDTGHTYSLWFKTSSATNPSASQYLMDKYYSTDRITLYIQTDGTLVFRFVSTNHSGTDDYDETCITSGSLATSSWYHIVATIDKNDTAGQKLYINGVLSVTGTDSVPSTILDNWVGGRSLKIGTDKDAGGNYFDGAICNVQVWSKEFTAADAEYAFLNPESLALNRSGTSLTESNLKLWYPMQDGHRGQQSYILDGAKTGLGDEVLTNGDFSSGETGWTATANWSVNSDGQAEVDSGNLQYTAAILVAGTTYKATFDIGVVSGGGGTISIHFRSAASPYTDYKVITTAGTHTVYFTSATTYFRFQEGGATDSSWTVDNVSIKAINDKNHATTVFHGDELVTNGDMEAAVATAGGAHTAGAAEDAASFAQSTAQANGGSNSGLLTADSSSTAPQVWWGDGSDIGMVVGRTYKVSADVYLPAGQGMDTIFLRVIANNNSTELVNTNTTTTNSWVTLTGTFIDDDIDRIKIFGYNGGAATNDEIFYIDNLTIKEVGTASGWTDADQQLHIPQTALQSYNELAWFDGVADYTTIADHNDFSFGDGTNDSEFSISAWIYMNDATTFPIVCKYSGSHKEWFLKTDGSDKLELQLYDNSASAYQGRLYDTALTSYEGKWTHVVATYSGDESNADAGINLYFNGEVVDDTNSNSGSYTAMENKDGVVAIGAELAGSNFANGAITEVSIWADNLSQAEVNELYNDGKALDATTHSASANISGYWRNNGLTTWSNLDNPGTLDGTPTSVIETVVIPAGVDSTRDTQGFLMNRQRDTSSLNQTSESDNTYGVDLVATSTFAAGEAFSMTFWAKPRDVTANQIMGNTTADSLRFLDTDSLRIKANNVTDNFDINNPSDWTIDDWVHVGIVRNTSNLVTTYVNGVAQSDTETVDEAFDYKYIGGIATSKFRGALDNFLIYDDELSAAEVERNYNATKGSHSN